jgi:hypothetical protein
MDRNYSFVLGADLEVYRGKWIAVVDGGVVASGINAKKVYEQAKKKCPGKEPLLDRVYGESILIV